MAQKSSSEVLITGAAGFVGSAVLRALVRARYGVRAIVRQTSRFDDLQSLGVQFVYGDLRNQEAVRSAMDGCRYVFHIAADYRLCASNRAEVFANNVEATRNVMGEAVRAGVERIVYTSSVATLRPRSDGSPADENDSLPEAEAIGAYKRSKIVAELFVRQMVADNHLPAVIVNPSTPIGARDIRPTPTGRIIVAAAAGRIPAYVETGLNLVHVDDVAAGHLAALRNGRIGERYILGGQNVPFSEMIWKITDIAGRPCPKFRLPWYLGIPVACAGEMRAMLTGRESLATWAGLQLARHQMYFETAKAQRELQLFPRSYIYGIQDAVRWYQDHGYLTSISGKPAL